MPVRVWGRRTITRARDASLGAPTLLRQTITTALWTQSDKATLLSFFSLVLFFFFYPFPCLAFPAPFTFLSQQHRIIEYLTGVSSQHLGVRSSRSHYSQVHPRLKSSTIHGLIKLLLFINLNVVFLKPNLLRFPEFAIFLYSFTFLLHIGPQKQVFLLHKNHTAEHPLTLYIIFNKASMEVVSSMSQCYCLVTYFGKLYFVKLTFPWIRGLPRLFSRSVTRVHVGTGGEVGWRLGSNEPPAIQCMSVCMKNCSGSYVHWSMNG